MKNKNAFLGKKLQKSILAQPAMTLGGFARGVVRVRKYERVRDDGG
jgi:hypothetical protein